MSIIKQKGGLVNTAKRALTLLQRHGLSDVNMKVNVVAYNNLVRKYKSAPTFFIPTTIYEKYKDTFYGMETGAHGWQHVYYTELTKEDIKLHLNRIEAKGFRAPYLAYNDFILSLLSKQFEFDSSTSHLWKLRGIIPNKEYQLSCKFYKPIESELPFMIGDMVEIPVSLPDDEMLVERLGIKDSSALFHLWKQILEKSRKNKSMFILQVHPERFKICEKAIEQLLLLATKYKDVWICTMKELADQWRKEQKWPKGYVSVFTVSGDVDRMRLL